MSRSAQREGAHPMSRPATVDAWLAYLETLHPKSIAMGLERVRAVRANLDAPIACPVVTVTGTNGKGSTCAMLESILRCAGYSVGLYTSPHLTRYNERIRIQGVDATDAQLLAAFNAVEDARLATLVRDGAPTLLTYFEFGTLAALWLFARAGLDALVLEVGLGGRLDAVNVVDATVAVLTSVAIDHTDYLGPTREDIGREKAGVFVPDVPPSAPIPTRRRACSRTPGKSARLFSRSAATMVSRTKARNGSTGGRAASASACRFPRCAVRIS